MSKCPNDMLMMSIMAMVVCWCSACSHTKPREQSLIQKSKGEAAIPKPLSWPRPALAIGPVGSVSGVEISAHMFNQRMIELGPHAARFQMYRFGGVVREIAHHEMFKRLAKKHGVVISDEAFDVFFQREKAALKAQYRYKRAVSRFRSEDGLKNALRRRMLERAVILKLQPITIPEEDVRRRFNQRKRYLGNERQVEASHILVRMRRYYNANRKAQAKQKADRVYGLAMQPGADFAALAKQYSEGPTRRRGGALGYFPKRRMVRPFEEAAFRMKVGEISKPVKTVFGYHIIKVTGIRPENIATYEKFREQIHKDLLDRKVDEVRRQVVGQWPVKVNPDNIKIRNRSRSHRRFVR